MPSRLAYMYIVPEQRTVSCKTILVNQSDPSFEKHDPAEKQEKPINEKPDPNLEKPEDPIDMKADCDRKYE